MGDPTPDLTPMTFEVDGVTLTVTVELDAGGWWLLCVDGHVHQRYLSEARARAEQKLTCETKGMVERKEP